MFPTCAVPFFTRLRVMLVSVRLAMAGRTGLKAAAAATTASRALAATFLLSAALAATAFSCCSDNISSDEVSCPYQALKAGRPANSRSKGMHPHHKICAGFERPKVRGKRGVLRAL